MEKRSFKMHFLYIIIKLKYCTETALLALCIIVYCVRFHKGKKAFKNHYFTVHLHI